MCLWYKRNRQMTKSSDMWVLTVEKHHVVILLLFSLNLNLCYFIFAFKMQLEPMLCTCSRKSVSINLPSIGDSWSLFLWELDPCHLSRMTEVKSKRRVLSALGTPQKQAYTQSSSARLWGHSLPTMALALYWGLAATYLCGCRITWPERKVPTLKELIRQDFIK